MRAQLCEPEPGPRLRPPDDLDQHFAGADRDVRAAFDRVLAAVSAFGPVQVLPQKTRIALQVRMSFAAFTPRRRWLSGHLVLARRADSPRFCGGRGVVAPQRGAHLPAHVGRRRRRRVRQVACGAVPGRVPAAPPSLNSTRSAVIADVRVRPTSGRQPDLGSPAWAAQRARCAAVPAGRRWPFGRRVDPRSGGSEFIGLTFLLRTGGP
jgi:hypothetical protein